MMELIHMTAAYSNAVLVAVLPHISDFADKLGLPVSTPISAEQVKWSKPSPYKDFISDAVILTNSYWFLYHWPGYVQAFRTPTNWFFEQEFTDQSVSRYLGEDHMTTNQVVEMARESLRQLGYSPEVTHHDKTPMFEGPFDIKKGHVPFCRVTWEWPQTESAAEEQNLIQVEVNMNAKSLVGLSLIFTRTNNPQAKTLKLNVATELESDYNKRVRPKMFVNTNAAPSFPNKTQATE